MERTYRLFDFNVSNKTVSLGDENSSEDSSAETIKKDNVSFIIQMFGINEEGKTCSITIDDYKPFFYIKVPESWGQTKKNDLLNHLKKKVGNYYSESITNFKLIQRKKLYGFDAGKEYRFIFAEFANMNAFNKIKKLWYRDDMTSDDIEDDPELLLKNKNKQGFRRRDQQLLPQGYKFITDKREVCFLELYESNIPPLLRFFHIQDISPTGWVALPVNKIKKVVRTTTCDFECKIEYKHIIPLNNKETRVPYKICSFDIEASSSHGDFPVPKKSYKKLATNIVDCFEKISKTQEITKELCKNALTCIILCAFGYVTFAKAHSDTYYYEDDVDLVYPKKTKSFDEVATLIQNLFKLKIDVSNDADDEPEGLTIESMFESKNKSLYTATAKTSEQKISSNDDDDSDAGSDDSDNDNEGGDAEETGGGGATWYSGAKKTAKYDKSNANVVSLLCDKTVDRSCKVEEINKLLTNSKKSNFPELEGDKVTFIGSTFLRYGQTEPYLNHCIALNTCDKLEQANSQIDSYDTEREVLIAWKDLIQTENPDIIIGYNIFGFDYTFMFQRALETNCVEDFLKLSRNNDEMCGTLDYATKKLKIEESSISIASGTHELQYIKMNGRIQIDMYNYFRREENLTSYKLDYVAGHFIGDDIKSVTHADTPTTTIIKTGNMMGLLEESFIHIEEIKHSVNYYKNGDKFKVHKVNKEEGWFSIHGHETPDLVGSKSVRWCLAKDDVTPQDIFRLSNGSSTDRAIVAKYCIQDCNLVHYLITKVDVLTGFIEMGKLCSVPMSFLVLRGQGIKLLSFVAKKCRDKRTLIPVIEKGSANDGYEGAIVLDPKCGLYLEDPVPVGDFASLYPSSMLSENISHDSKVWTKEYDLANNLVKETGIKNRQGEFAYDNLPGYEYVQIKYDTYTYVREKPTAKAKKVLSGHKVCCYAQFPEGRAIMPSILEELLTARKTTRKLIPQQSDEFMKNVLDKRQLAYKVTANSLYGQCGAKTSAFYEQDAAASTTATGRLLLTYAKKVVEECYGDNVCQTEKYGSVCTKAEYIYGDSVANYTPVYVKVNNVFDVCTIDQLADKYGNSNWVTCKEEGKQEKEFCELENVETWTEKGWTKLYRVIRHLLAPHKKIMRIMTGSATVDVTDDHSLVTSEGAEISPKDVVVGTKLLHHEIYTTENKQIIDDFINNYNNSTIKAPTQLYSAIYELKLEKHASDHYGCCNYFKRNEKLDKVNIIRSADVPYQGYVYDLTTDNHHFAAGVGSMIVHNTDSVFFTFHLTTPEGEKIVGEKALEISIEIAKEATHMVSQFLKAPHDFEYEKTFSPFCLLSKKRYVGMMYEHNPKKGKRKEMGIVLKRRDNAPIVKDIYGGIIDIFMKEQNLQKAITFLKRCLQDIVDENIPIDKLIITKSLNSFYKKPQQIAHKVLADRIALREPGNKPKSGDRIPFVYIVGSKKDLQGNKIETPTFIAHNNIKIDYSFYITNQIMKPLLQLFGLVLEEMWDMKKMKGKIVRFKTEIEKIRQNTPKDKFEDKLEKLKGKEVKALLFDDYLRETTNAKNGDKAITGFFAPTSK
jgi:DNA polymerase elongation subunit (family B)